MKKTLWTVGVIVLILLALCVILPYPMGYFAEKRYREVVTAFSSAAHVEVKLVRYERGWFHSRAMITVNFKRPGLEFNKAAQVINKSLWAELRFKEDVTHGPVIFQMGIPEFAQAGLHGWLDLTPEQSKALGPNISPASLLTSDTTISLTGAMRTKVQSPAFVAKQNDRTLDWQGAKIMMVMPSDLRGLKLFASFAGMNYTQGTTVVGVGPITMGYRGKEHNSGIWAGSHTVSVDKINIQDTKMQFGLNGFVNAAKTSVKNGTLSSGSQTSLDHLNLNGAKFSSGLLDIETNKIDIATLASMQQVRRMKGGQTPAIDQRMQLAGFLLELLNKGVVFKLNKFYLMTPWGGVSADGHATFQPVPQQQARMGPFFILRTMAASVNIQMPAVLTKILAQQYYGYARPKQGEALYEQIAAQWLTAAVEQGALIKVDGGYKVNVSFKGGRLLVNGKPFRPIKVAVPETTPAFAPAPKGVHFRSIRVRRPTLIPALVPVPTSTQPDLGQTQRPVPNPTPDQAQPGPAAQPTPAVPMGTQKPETMPLPAPTQPDLGQTQKPVPDAAPEQAQPAAQPTPAVPMGTQKPETTPLPTSTQPDLGQTQKPVPNPTPDQAQPGPATQTAPTVPTGTQKPETTPLW